MCMTFRLRSMIEIGSLGDVHKGIVPGLYFKKFICIILHSKYKVCAIQNSLRSNNLLRNKFQLRAKEKLLYSKDGTASFMNFFLEMTSKPA